LKARTTWLLAAVVLLVFAGIVLGRGENAGKAAARRAKLEKVRFPRYPKSDEYDRMQRRRTLPPLPQRASGPPPVAPEQNRDPLLSALGARSAVDIVFEAGSFYRMPLAQQLLECFGADAQHEFDRMREKTGIDVEAVDRIAVMASEDGRTALVVSAKFDSTRVGALLGPSTDRVQYGDRGALFLDPGAGPDGGKGSQRAIATWSDSLIVLGESKSDVMAALDRVEGRVAPLLPAIMPETAYGEIYGHVRASVLAKMLPPEITEALRAAEDVELHVDATEDVLIVADVRGGTPSDMNNLARTFGGALSAARITAQAQGNEAFAELLDLARVTPSAGSFVVEAAMPVEFIKRQLGGCSKH
jgi:hypothetical protein